jgi:hypothetical protein
MATHTKDISDLHDFKSNTQGKFTIIVWLLSGLLTLQIGMIVSLFVWGLNHITLRVEAQPITQSKIVQDANRW